jgi:hypothetical protein
MVTATLRQPTATLRRPLKYLGYIFKNKQFKEFS